MMRAISTTAFRPDRLGADGVDGAHRRGRRGAALLAERADGRGAQWQHPIDDFVKAAIKALRTPLHPHSSFLITSLLGPGAMEPPE